MRLKIFYDRMYSHVYSKNDEPQDTSCIFAINNFSTELPIPITVISSSRFYIIIAARNRTHALCQTCDNIILTLSVNYYLM
jgi:hypothetical protein